MTSIVDIFNLNKEMVLLCLVLMLTVAFYFTDPQKFLENLGYAVLATLSIYEAIQLFKNRKYE